MQNIGEHVPTELQNLVMEERSRSRFTRVDFAHSVRLLGFGSEGPLGVDFDDTVEDEFIINAWKDGVRRSWRDPVDGASARRDLNDAFRIIAEMRGNSELRKIWEQEKGSIMTVDTAYSTLGVSKDMDETTLITVFLMRVSWELFRILFPHFLSRTA
jgi:ubiquitin carboxyl-terminal hydrolase 25